MEQILWAVDPFSNTEVLNSSALAIRALVQKTPAQVQPVYVLPVPVIGRSPEDFQQYCQEKLDVALARAKFRDVLPIKILTPGLSGLREQVREVIEYARILSCELIVTTTHARRGLKRLFVGSFSETLMLQSDIPLLILHPALKAAPEFKNLLFPTDFTEGSMAAYSRVLDFAAARKSRVILFHKVGLPSFPVFEVAFVRNPIPAKELEAEAKVAKLEAGKWIEQAKRRGVRAELVVDHSLRQHSLTEAVLSQCKRLNCVIAIASLSDLGSAVLLGSTTRQIVRQAEQPVWVIHPQPLRSSIRKSA